ncbi:NUDIX domain-containing protein [Streptomyces sp. NPDC048606]|uniref:NUDIX domain-containing protein n=1 Tax=Streptomyces sp. NPDC048606 TaxID=3154726 RepID=UPI0034334A72
MTPVEPGSDNTASDPKAATDNISDAERELYEGRLRYDQSYARHEGLPHTEVTSPPLRAKLLQARLDGRPDPVNVSALIHDGQGRYLLHLRDHEPGVIWESGAFALLGGERTHDDESLEGTLLRELSEDVPDLRLEDFTPYAVEDARHAAENPPGNEPAVVPAVWDGGDRVVLNGVGVHLHLEDDEGRVLLGLRHRDSKYAGDTWHYLAGRCEQESALNCLVREAWEEAGLVIDPADVELAHVVHVVDAPGSLPLMQLVFRARRWEGTPEVREPDKCLTWQWWPPHELPDRLVSYTRTAISSIAEGHAFSQVGW